MVKPQPKIRRPHVSDDEDNGRESFDSMRSPVTSRTYGGKEPFEEPDFIIVKSGPKFGDDTALAVVEIKRNEKPSKDDKDQIIGYMQIIKQKNPATDVKGYLVARRDTYIYGLDNIESYIEKIDTEKEFQKRLELHATNHW
jgi:hypothetical protein